MGNRINFTGQPRQSYVAAGEGRKGPFMKIRNKLFNDRFHR